jgi:23S rRNA pseudouridine1911/1915/1917 synthase
MNRPTSINRPGARHPLTMPARQLTADRGDHALRLDRMIRRHLADVAGATRTRVQRWIEDGLVTVNGATVRKVSTRTMAGDLVRLELPPAPARTVMAAEPISVDVRFEDDYLLVVNKPAGIVAHPAYRHLTGTLMNALLWHARGWPPAQRPSLVSRLDQMTSGVVVVAKTAAAHAALQRALTSRTCGKDYLALVYGRVTPPQGDIEWRLRRDPFDRRRVIASRSAGAPSLTRYVRVARGPAAPVGLALVHCRLMTGRTHQIRVHLAANGWPIVGDPLYGAPRWRDIANSTLAATLRAFPRQALHAARVSFTHPVTGAPLVVDAPPPPDLARLLADALPGVGTHAQDEIFSMWLSASVSRIPR